jgi:radical SAM protein (TIGR01212 family)
MQCAQTLSRQVEQAMGFLQRRYAAEAFILFFQAFSNTNAPVAVLQRVYDEGLDLAPFRGLSVATRPDCIDEEKADLLSSYKGRGLDVWVELGLQTSSEATLERIGRGHTVDQFVTAYRILKSRGLKVAVHLIFGLPGESLPEILETIQFVAALEADGVKIHNIHVPAGTVLAREYAMGEFTPPGPDSHIEYVIAAIERLPRQTVIMRLLCETPEERLLAPRSFPVKQQFNDQLAAAMRGRGAFQGRLYAPRRDA